MRTLILAAGLAVAAPAVHAAQTGPDKVYRLDRVTPLKGRAPGWDYLTLDPARNHLFIGRRTGGVTVYDIKTHQVAGQVQNSAGANIGLPVPELGKGFTANADGSSTVFSLTTFKTTGHVKLGEGADAVFFDPSTRQMVFTMGDTQQIAFMDGKTAKVSGYLNLGSKQIEGVAPDGKGALYVALRDKDTVAKVDAAKHSLIAAWTVPGCQQPTGMAYDPATNRVFAGCKGDKPMLSVLDGDTGKLVAQHEIGHGNDGVKFVAGKVYTSNGVDSLLVIFDQIGADQYRLEQAVTTRPIARTMAIDPATRRIWTVTAEGFVDPSKPVNTRAAPFYPNQYYDDSFVLLEYGLHPKPAGAGDDG